jgi:uncharacterized protein (DUF433 family)
MGFESTVLREDETYEYGETREILSDGGRSSPTAWMRLKHDLWFVAPPVEALAACGVSCSDPLRASGLANLFADSIAAFDYVTAASPPGSEEAIKWILGALAAHIKEHAIPVSRIGSVMPADWLRAFCAGLESGAVPRGFAKEVFAALVDSPRFLEYFGDDVVHEMPGLCGGRATFRNRRIGIADMCARVEADVPAEELMDDYAVTPAMLVHGFAWLEAREFMGWMHSERVGGPAALADVLRDPRFKASDPSVVAALVADVMAANPEQAAKAKADPRVVQWLVGQAMKAGKGRVPAPEVKAAFEAALA